MSAKLRTVVAGLTLLLLPMPTAAWNDTAHMVIAHIAYSRLNPAAAARVTESASLLRYRGEKYNQITIATYMDDVRADPFYDYLRPLHFFLKPLEDDVTAPSGSQPGEKSDRDLTHINKIIETLKQGKVPADEEARIEEAQLVAYLIHLVGDTHQPLHCVNRFSEEHPDGDAGGNLFFIKGESRSLHSFWDDAGGLFGSKPIARPLDTIGLEAIRNYAYAITKEYSDTKSGWSKMAVEAWLEESYEIAKDDVYDSIRQNEVPSSSYVEKAQEISRKRLTMAGYRLAALLNDIYREPRRPVDQPSRPLSPRPATKGTREPNK